MPVTVKLPPERINGRDLCEVYKCFCTAYGLEPDVRDVRFMLRGAKRHLTSAYGLDYRPFMGAKFFGQRSTDGTEFWGYVDIKSNEYRNADLFAALVKAYFTGRRKRR